MDIAPHWHNLVDISEEFQELSCPMARQALANHLTGFDVECCEERGRAMTLVVVGHGGGAPLLQPQPRLGPIKVLDLGLLIHAQHDRPIRRVEVKPDDFGDLSLEHRIVRDLEPLRDMRLETGLRPFGGKPIPRIDF
jgi:hypothetical protein